MMRRLLLLTAFTLFGSLALLAQENCYETQRTKGISLYNQGEYAAAYKNFEAAKLCTDLPSNNDLDEWLDKCTIFVRVSPKKLTFFATSVERQCVVVSTNARSFKVGNVPSWCQVTYDGKTLFVDCNENFTLSSRSARIPIMAGGKTAMLEIVQDAADLEVSIDPETLSFPSVEETKRVSVSTNASEWNVKSYPDWVVVQKESHGLEVKSIPNVTPQSRQGLVMISVAEKQFPIIVSQVPGDTLIEVGRKDVVFDNLESSTKIAVASNMSHWEVESSDKWIEVEAEGDSVMVAVAENQSLFSRHGYVRVSVGYHFCDVMVHQCPFVSKWEKPVPEIQYDDNSNEEVIMVKSFPSNLRVYVDDSIVRFTPFTCQVDYEHHSLSVGNERREFFFNDKQEEIVFEPGLRFATITFAPNTAWGMMTGFVDANSFGAFTHFQAATPIAKDFVSGGEDLSGYNMTFGVVYQPSQFPYVGGYAGLGVGAYVLQPHIGLDYEAGLMGFYKNLMLTLGFHHSRINSLVNKTSFVIGVGGYLKRYNDPGFGYCASDSRRWWSVNYMWRPATGAKGVMFSDLGREKTRAYVKAFYLRSVDSLATSRDVDLSVGLVFTPVNGIIDLCAGLGADITFISEASDFNGVGFHGLAAELGVILNVWRIPITVMLHESDLLNDRRMYVDFGIGFHFGDFRKSSYK